MTPETVHYPGTRSISYRLELTSGDAPERVTVSAIAPRYAGPPYTPSLEELVRQRRRGLSRFVATGEIQPTGSPIAPLGQLDLFGARQRIPLYPHSIPPDISYFSPYRSCTRGYGESVRHVAFRLPARSSAIVVGRYRTGRSAPWVDTDYRLAFVVRHRPDIPGTRLSSSAVRVVRPPQPRRRGSVEVRLRIRIDHGIWAPLGSRIQVLGRTDPPVRQGLIRLLFRAGRSLDSNFGPAKVLADVRTDGRGRFAYRGWRAAYRLNYEVWARHRSAGRRFESCSATIRLGGRPPI